MRVDNLEMINYVLKLNTEQMYSMSNHVQIITQFSNSQMLPRYDQRILGPFYKTTLCVWYFMVKTL